MRNRWKSGLRAAALGLLMINLAGCKSDGESLFAPAADSQTNNPPVITGKPRTSVVAGETYAFQPKASDPDGNALDFSIDNKPAWAEFDASTGRLSGKPSASDTGVVAGVRITVSDGKATSAVGPFNIRVNSKAAPSPTPP